MCDFLKIYLSFNNFEQYRNHILSIIFKFIDKREIQGENASGFKLLKKKMDSIKEQIEHELKDQNIKEIFKEPSNLEGVETGKVTDYLKAVIFYTLEDRFKEIGEKDQNMEP